MLLPKMVYIYDQHIESKNIFQHSQARAVLLCVSCHALEAAAAAAVVVEDEEEDEEEEEEEEETSKRLTIFQTI